MGYVLRVVEVVNYPNLTGVQRTANGNPAAYFWYIQDGSGLVVATSNFGFVNDLDARDDLAGFWRVLYFVNAQSQPVSASLPGTQGTASPQFQTPRGFQWRCTDVTPFMRVMGEVRACHVTYDVASQANELIALANEARAYPFLYAQA